MNSNKKTDTALYITGWVLLLSGFIVLSAARRYSFDPVRLLPPCPFHTITGLYCPGCGGTRAVCALLRGDIFRSLRFHPLVPTTAAAAGWFMISQTIERISGGRIRIGMHFREICLWAALFLLSANFLVKNAALMVWHIDLMPV